MSCLRAPVSKVLTWSCVDGPGNRLVLFLQGCNYACLACHNPHTIGQCDDCGLCVPVCAPGALRLEGGKIHFDANLCTDCDACLDICPISASPMTREMSVSDVLALLRENAGFLSGITVSGGEATMHAAFIAALFAAMGDDPQLRHLTRFIDSNGHLGAEGWQALIPVTDGVMLDIKAFAPDTHRTLTARSNARSLAAAQRLNAAGKLYELRYLMVPGATDTDAEIDALIAFAKSLKPPVRIRLNGFRRHGVRGVAADWPAMPRDALVATAGRLENAGLGPVSLPVL